MSEVRFLEPSDPIHGFISNFYRAEIDVDGQRWPTVEHYYQAQKFTDAAYAERIRQAATPREAKTLGQTRAVPLRDDWEVHKMNTMLRALAAKFTQHAALQEKLLATGDAILVEVSPTDSFWGDAAKPDGAYGESRLGYLLTTLRDHLRLWMERSPNLVATPAALAEHCFGSVQLSHLVWWLTEDVRLETQISMLGDSVTAYVRDTDLPEGYLQRYQPGLIFREPTLCDASCKPGGFAAKHRFLLLSGNGRRLGDLFGNANPALDAGLTVWSPGTLWKVLAQQRVQNPEQGLLDTPAQITLLEVPPLALHAFNIAALTTLEKNLVDYAEQLFVLNVQSHPLEAHLHPEWMARTRHPLGIGEDGEFIECWSHWKKDFPGLPDQPDQPIPKSAAADLAPTDQHVQTQPEAPRYQRLLGVPILLIGLGLAAELVWGGSAPLQMVVLSAVMVALGAAVVLGC